ncbi:MAG TPA: POTRA domain-containing protein [Gemmatimonadales bacterium]|nr:POTRA domain-containing protein [Gemmatimonadales bacterium]
MIAAACLSDPARAQGDALIGIGPGTEVRKITFDFQGEHRLTEGELRSQLALTNRPGWILPHKLLGWFPLIGPVGAHPFNPLELQRDVVRLRNLYQRNGYLDAQVTYDVTYDAEPDFVDITYHVREGPPLQLTALRFVAPGNAPLDLAPELAEPWAEFTRSEGAEGGRFGEGERQGLADRTSRWLRNRGYPFATVEANALVDTAANHADVTVVVDHGMRARVREIAVTGNETVPDRQFARQLPISQGDWYDANRLEQGRQQLSQLSAVRLALINVPRPTTGDSSVVVNLKVAENPPYLVRGDAGLVSTGGLTGNVEWTDRTFLGGLRTMTIAVTAQTGVLALEQPPEKRYRVSATVFQPYVGNRRLSFAGGPFAEYRDDLRDRSRAIGFTGALVYAESPLRSVSLGYTISGRRVYDYGFSSGLDPIEYLPLLNLADSATVGALDNTVNRSVLTLQGSWGHLDQFANPRQGYVLRPRAEITLPGFNTSEYFLLDMGAAAFMPLGRQLGFTIRGGVGRIFAYGKSLENVGNESPFVSLLRLRDVTFTAGGTRDVRGWGSQLVGPKLPEVQTRDVNGVTIPAADRYTPVGGLARATASAEVHSSVPGLGDKWDSFVFLDGGKIWTPDERFALNAGELDQDKFFLGTGVGFGYETVVGAVQVAVGYKLNPSPLDLRDPNDVLNALADGTPIDDLPTSAWRRLQLHFSIGATF